MQQPESDADALVRQANECIRQAVAARARSVDESAPSSSSAAAVQSDQTLSLAKKIGHTAVHSHAIPINTPGIWCTCGRIPHCSASTKPKRQR